MALDSNIKSQLTAYLEKLVQPIELVASVNDGDKSLEMLELLREIASISAKINLIERHDDEELKPSFTVGRVGQVAQIRLNTPTNVSF